MPGHASLQVAGLEKLITKNMESFASLSSLKSLKSLNFLNSICLEIGQKCLHNLVSQDLV